jgi:hypothetical protein
MSFKTDDENEEQRGAPVRGGRYVGPLLPVAFRTFPLLAVDVVAGSSMRSRASAARADLGQRFASPHDRQRRKSGDVGVEK